MKQSYEYFCKKCKIEITTDEPGFIKCPKCKSGRDILDYGEYEEPEYITMGGGAFNWNKK